MKKEMDLYDKHITLYYDSLDHVMPVIVFNADDENVFEIYSNIKSICKIDFIFAAISNINWNNDMSPWFMEKLFKGGDDYLGDADNYIMKLTKIILKINEAINNMAEEYILAGYSLAGLFSIYALYKTNIFTKAVSCSGSFWYPNFLEFIQNNKMIAKPKRIYLSLGNLESNTKNSLIREVYNKTIAIKNHFIALGIDTLYEEHEGNHFKDVSLRIAKGIKAILE